MNNALIETFRQSGVVGQLIIFFLLGLSVCAWYIILDKLRYLRAAERSSMVFLKAFRAESSRARPLRFPGEMAGVSPLYRIYLSALDVRQRAAGSTRFREELEESLCCAVSREQVVMEHLLVVLAVTATISPLMGLLGTVWGIMNAFRGMATAGTASIGTVAPGVSEALVTTVVGLLVAVPAVAGYNIIAARIRRMSVEMDNFVSELVSRMTREG